MDGHSDSESCTSIALALSASVRGLANIGAEPVLTASCTHTGKRRREQGGEEPGGGLRRESLARHPENPQKDTKKRPGRPVSNSILILYQKVGVLDRLGQIPDKEGLLRGSVRKQAKTSQNAVKTGIFVKF